MNRLSGFRRHHLTAVFGLAFCLGLGSSAGNAKTIFQVTSFASPAWSLTYFTGFSGTVGVTTTWPSEMGWQGDQIDIAFALDPNVPAQALQYRFRIVITQHFSQSFEMAVWAGPSLADLVQVQSEYVDSARVLVATIPLARFAPGQTNYLRIKGTGVLVGEGQLAGVQWNKWLLTRVDLASTLDAVRTDQLQRTTWYLQNAIRPNGMVRDFLPYSPSVQPYAPATPDAAGFALLGLCAADRLGLITNAEALATSILSAYSGHTAGVTPARTADGHWVHFMDPNTGLYAGNGWDGTYSTIGSALLVDGALFAKNHFISNATIAARADELYSTTNFNAAIHPSLDGRVYLGMAVGGGGVSGEVHPWNEYMLVVSLALREPNNQRALAIESLWLNPANVPHRSFQGIVTLTDNAAAYAPAFWEHQQHFFNADFASNADFEMYFGNHQQADALYCAMSLSQTYRYGLTAGVDPNGYFADCMYNHHNVLSPEAVVGWGDLQTMLEFVQDQPPTSNSRFRYGLTRVSAADPNWIPSDAALVDHLFLMLGLVESLNPDFFRQRQPFQTDADSDGIADAYDNCPSAWNPRQEDSDDDGIGDACECGTPWADTDGNGDVSLADFALIQSCPRSANMPEDCLCFDRNGSHTVDAYDLDAFANCLATSGPGIPADPNCGP